MPYQVEVCIDNIESLSYAEQGGADRIELCSSLALGGLTPSIGFIKQAVKQARIPIYAMIRPRQGDFLYQDDDIEIMLEDIYHAKQAGVAGVVFGVLNQHAEIDMPLAQVLMRAAQGLGVTFHRAVDQCRDYRQAIENIAELGCERLLTSGLSPNAYDGRDTIADMVTLANQRFSVMAGAGVNADNVSHIILRSGVKEVHLSAKITRPSQMKRHQQGVRMGDSAQDEHRIPMTDQQKVRDLVARLTALG
jgi:copper homeostasis protein